MMDENKVDLKQHQLYFEDIWRQDQMVPLLSEQWDSDCETSGSNEEVKLFEAL